MHKEIIKTMTTEFLEKVILNDKNELEFHFKTRNKTKIIKTDGETVVRLYDNQLTYPQG